MKPSVDQIKARLVETDDFITRDFSVEGEQVVLIYLESLCDTSKMEISVLKQWFHAKAELTPNLQLGDLLTAVDLSMHTEMNDIIKALLEGKALVGYRHTGSIWYALSAEKFNIRSIQEPENEPSIIGERVGFVEQLSVNLNLLRSRTSSPRLKIRYLMLGKYGSCKVAVLWEEGMADEEVVSEAIKRISSLKTNLEIHPGRLIPQLKENKYSLFPQVFATERVDTVASLLMQGRVAVICDQSSTCLIVPVSFYTFIRSVDALLLGSSNGISITLHVLRGIGLLLGIYICSLYIAIVSFHHEVLPASMTISIKSSLENVPYPPILEAALMILIFQMIAEATIRLPSQIAQMVGVAGGIIISESLVKIGFVSNVFLVIVALSVIGSFLIPTYHMRMFVLVAQIMMVLGAWVMGFYGIVFLTVALLVSFFSLETFGVPYSLPIRSKEK